MDPDFLMGNYTYKSTPYSHQGEEFERTRTKPSWARLWEQGTGKTKPTIDEIAWLWKAQEINAVIVVAPSGVHSNWVTDEIPEHLPNEVAAVSSCLIWRASKANTLYFKKAASQLLKHSGLAWLCITYDAFMTKQGKDFLKAMLAKRKVFYVLDESIAIKTPGIKLTKSVVASGKYAVYRRILNGTPIANAPFDAYTQIKFLDEHFWKRKGLDDFGAFKTFFGEWETGTKSFLDQAGKLQKREYPVLTRYRNLTILRDELKTISSRVLKAEVLDLPEKLYTKRYFQMTPKQASIYEELRRDYMVELDNGQLATAELAIVRLLRLSQITSGYLATPDNEEEPVYIIPGGNPRIELMEELRDTVDGQCLVWARFNKDIDQLMALFGKDAVRYDGAVDEIQRDVNRKAFKAGEFKWFVSKTRVGKSGLTLNEANTTIYYNNTFSFTDRTQSEDRNHRIGQGDKVLYIDVVAEGTVDEKIIKSLREKLDIASQITGDKLKEWI